MSSHHSQKSINLHHSQVNAGKERREQRQIKRHEAYLAMRSEARLHYNIVLVFAFIWFAYLQIAPAVYLRYVL